MGKPKGTPFMTSEYDERMEYDILVHIISTRSGQNIWYEREGDSVVFYTDGDLNEIEKFMQGTVHGSITLIGVDRATFEMSRTVYEAHERAGANARWN